MILCFLKVISVFSLRSNLCFWSLSKSLVKHDVCKGPSKHKVRPHCSIESPTRTTSTVLAGHTISRPDNNIRSGNAGCKKVWIRGHWKPADAGKYETHSDEQQMKQLLLANDLDDTAVVHDDFDYWLASKNDWVHETSAVWNVIIWALVEEPCRAPSYTNMS